MLVSGNGDQIDVGAPLVDGSRVTGVVVEHGRAPKIIVFKKKRRKQYKKTHGHRQDFTAVRIESIGAESRRPEKAEAEEVKAQPATSEATDAAETAAAATESTEAASETSETNE